MADVFPSSEIPVTLMMEAIRRIISEDATFIVTAVETTNLLYTMHLSRIAYECGRHEGAYILVAASTLLLGLLRRARYCEPQTSRHTNC
jgi:hypothetical protein